MEKPTSFLSRAAPYIFRFYACICAGQTVALRLDRLREQQGYYCYRVQAKGAQPATPHT